MRVVSVPIGLRAAAAVLFSFIPLAILEAHFLRTWPIQNVAVVAVLSVALLSLLLLNGKKGALPLIFTLFTGWTLGGGWLAVRNRDAGLGYLILLQSAFFFLFLMWIRWEFQRSFIDPQLRWFQGMPRPLPWMRCQIEIPGASTELRVGRLDREGVFLFCGGASQEKARALWAAAGKTGLIDVVLRLRDRELGARGVIRGVLDRGIDGFGIGLQFSGMTPDARKALGDFIEYLRGEGYEV